MSSLRLLSVLLICGFSFAGQANDDLLICLFQGKSGQKYVRKVDTSGSGSFPIGNMIVSDYSVSKEKRVGRPTDKELVITEYTAMGITEGKKNTPDYGKPSELEAKLTIYRPIDRRKVVTADYSENGKMLLKNFKLQSPPSEDLSENASVEGEPTITVLYCGPADDESDD